MYRNSKGYPDPTAGAAFAHIAHEERMKRRRTAEAQRKKESEKQVHKLKKKKTKARKKNPTSRPQPDKVRWIKAWPHD